MRFKQPILVSAMTLAITFNAGAQVTEYTNKQVWMNAVGGNATTITFTEFSPGFVTDQYADLGITFTDGNDFIYNAGSFVNDGFGLGGVGSTHILFSEPMSWIAVDFPGLMQIKLYSDNALIYTSSVFWTPSVGGFGGLVSTHPFNKAELIDPAGSADIDDLHFGPPIPGPGALALMLGAAAMMGTRRRNRS